MAKPKLFVQIVYLTMFVVPNTRRPQTFSMTAKLYLFILSLLLTLYIAFTAIQIWTFTDDATQHTAEVAIVLGAAVIDGEPSPVFEQRIAHGIQLYHTNQVEMLIFTGGVGEGDTIAESEIGRNQAIKADVPSNKILIETESRITQQNLLFACELMKKHQLKTALIVSDPLHMKRATSIADTVGLQAAPSPTQTSAYKTWRSKLPSLAYETFFYTLHIFQLNHPTC